MVGTGQEPVMELSAPVGGPLASLKADAAILLQLVQCVEAQDGAQAHLLVFIECLLLLDIPLYMREM